MRKQTTDFIEKGRRRDPNNDQVIGHLTGSFVLRHPSGSYLLVVAHDGVNWKEFGFQPPAFEHVSVRLEDSLRRCPTWDEMKWVKEQFWEPEECVIQLHPPASVYVNDHEFVLHLWRPVGIEIPLPPRQCV